MSARKGRTASPVLDGTVDVPPAAPAVLRVRVRLKAGGPEVRHRAGLRFVCAPVELEVPPAVLAALQADAWLAVEVLP